MTAIILGISEEGLVHAIIALGVHIIYRILGFPDLSMNGTFLLGTTFTATGIAGGFIHPAVALPLSFLLGAVTGCVTGLIHVKLKVRDLLSGIVVMAAPYSINLRVAGKSNLPIFSRDTIFSNPWLERTIPQALKPYTVTVVLLAIVLICKLLLDAYLKTRSDYLPRTVGDNDLLVTSPAKGKDMVKIIDLAVTNGFAVLAGSIYCQQKGFFEISTGAGTIIIGLVNVIIDTQLFERFGFVRSTAAVIISSVICKACVSLALFLGDLRLTSGGIVVSFPVTASDLKLITSILFLIIPVASSSRGEKVENHVRAEAHQ